MPREQAFEFSTCRANHCVLGHNGNPQDLKSGTWAVSNHKVKATGNNNGAGRISSNDAEIGENKNADSRDADKNGQVTWHASGGEMTKGTRTATEAAACIMSVCQLVFSERRSSNGGKVDDKGSQSFLSQVPILTQCLFDTNVVASMKEQWHNC